MNTAASTEPRRLTGPWDERIVKAHRVAQDMLAWKREPETSEDHRQARRSAMYVPGEPATLYVGSDSYAMLVVAVDRYKSGAKKGQVSAIHAIHRNYDGSVRPEVEWDFTGEQPTYTYGVETFTRRERRGPATCWQHRPDRMPSQFDTDPADCFPCWEQQQPRFVEKGNDYGSLVVGYAQDYRDPHF
jgi:hypothetical protein